MAARRRSHKTCDLPPNLYVRNGYYSFRDPRTGKEFGLGRDKRYAVTQAIEANISLYSQHNSCLMDRMSGKSTITLHTWLERYVEILSERNLKPKTMQDYRERIKAVKSGIDDIHLHSVTTRHISALINSFERRGKNTTAKLIRSTLNDAFREAIAEGYIQDNPVAVTRNPRVKVMRSRLTVEHYRAVLSCTTGMAEWVALSLRLALITGQRVGDISKMKWSHIVNDHLKIQQEKTGIKLAIPVNIELKSMPDRLSDVLSSCKPLSESEFIISTHRNLMVPARTIAAKFAEARNSTGIEWEGTPPSFHELRSLSARLHTTERGAEFAQQLLGHKTSQMTDRYRDVRGGEWNVILI